MEYTGISKEIKGFVPRESEEEFFRDGKVIKDLFKWTEKLISNKLNFSCSFFTLSVFNQAYLICWLTVHENISIRRINEEYVFGKDLERNHSLAVAYTLLRLHKEFYPLTARIRMEFSKILPVDFYGHYYMDFVKGRSLSHPIDFRASFLEEVKITEVDLAKTKKHILVAMDKAIKLEEENKELGKQLEEERRMRKTAELTIEEKQTKLNCFENDAFYKAVNINSILKYAQDRGNCDNSDIKTIRMMLLALCANKVPNDVIEAIKTLKLGGNITIGEQHNHGCQQFYGNITNSEFPSK